MTTSKDNNTQCEACRGHNQEISDLRDELKKATSELAKTFEGASPNSQVDLGTESPLNLFIECFKQKYGLSVNPNEVAIFV